MHGKTKTVRRKCIHLDFKDQEVDLQIIYSIPHSS